MRSFVTSVAAIVLALTGTALSQCGEVSDINSWILGGSAALQDNVVYLTPQSAAAGGVGEAWYQCGLTPAFYPISFEVGFQIASGRSYTTSPGGYGISFVLADGNAFQPSFPANGDKAKGGLLYMPENGFAGMTGAIVGVGFDEINRGNWTTTPTSQQQRPASVVGVRGSSENGFPLLGWSPLPDTITLGSGSYNSFRVVVDIMLGGTVNVHVRWKSAGMTSWVNVVEVFGHNVTLTPAKLRMAFAATADAQYNSWHAVTGLTFAWWKTRDHSSSGGQGPKEPLPTWAIIVIAAGGGGLLLLILVIVIVACVCAKRRKRAKNNGEELTLQSTAPQMVEDPNSVKFIPTSQPQTVMMTPVVTQPFQSGGSMMGPGAQLSNAGGGMTMNAGSGNGLGMQLSSTGGMQQQQQQPMQSGTVGMGQGVFGSGSGMYM